MFALFAGAALPASVAFGIDADLNGVAAAATCGLAVIAGLGYLAFGVLRRAVVEPLQSLTQAMDQLRAARGGSRVVEAGAPLLHAVMRLFNLAANSIQEREHLSQANLMSVEVAFDRVHSVLQSLHEGVIVVDREDRVVLANRTARQQLGGGTAMEGRQLGQFVDRDLDAALRTAFARLDATGAEETHVSDVARDGRIYDLTVVRVQSTRPDHDFGKVVVLVDTTRNHEISQLKDDLLSSISHELRTPLTNMCSSSEILAQMATPEDSDLREFAQMLNQESHRLKSLVDDVLQYNQLETGRLHLSQEQVDLVPIVRSACQAMEPRLQQERLQLEVHSGESAKAQADPRRVAEVLLRLLDNAITFTPAGGRIRVEIQDHEGIAELVVADSGPGIALEDRQRVFERFTQIGNLMTEKPKGAGLGLAICQRLVDAMQGNIWCDDSPLGGAAIHFVLPQQQPVELAD